MKFMKYVVQKEFLDRFDNLRHCKPGEQHVPPNKERAEQLVNLGFITPVADKPKSKAAGDPDGKQEPDKPAE